MGELARADREAGVADPVPLARPAPPGHRMDAFVVRSAALLARGHHPSHDKETAEVSARKREGRRTSRRAFRGRTWKNNDSAREIQPFR